MLTTPCPKCGYLLEMTTALNNHPDTKPSEGDLSICLDCGEILQFNALLALEPFDLASLTDQVTNADECRRLMTKAQKIIHDRGRINKKKTPGGD